MKIFLRFVIIVFSLVFALGCNNQPKDVWTLDNYTLEESKKGTIEYSSFYSDKLGMDWEYGVYLPAGYDTNKEYPVVYLLHGGSDHYKSWITKGSAYDTINRAIANGKLPESIVIFPEGNPKGDNSYYVNSELYMMEDAFEKELIPYIETNYKIKKDRTAHSIGGLSMGGYGSLRFALRNPEYFSTVFVMSPAVWVEMDEARVKKMEGMRMYGVPFNKELWDSQNYPALWETYASKNMPLRFFISSGTDDKVTYLSSAKNLSDFLKEKNVEHIYIEQPYLDHEWGAWAMMLPLSLEFVGKNK